PLSPHHAEGRDQVLVEDLHLVVAEDNGHVDPGFGKYFGQPVERPVALRMARAHNLGRTLLVEPIRPPMFGELIKPPHLAPEGMLACAVGRYPQRPLFGRRREHWTVRESHAENYFRHIPFPLGAVTRRRLRFSDYVAVFE